MLVVIVVEVVAGVYVFMSRTEIANTVEVKMHDLMKHYNETDSGGIKQSWDALQHDVSVFEIEILHICRRK